MTGRMSDNRAALSEGFCPRCLQPTSYIGRTTPLVGATTLDYYECDNGHVRSIVVNQGLPDVAAVSS